MRFVFQEKTKLTFVDIRYLNFVTTKINTRLTLTNLISQIPLKEIFILLEMFIVIELGPHWTEHCQFDIFLKTQIGTSTWSCGRFTNSDELIEFSYIS